MFSLPQTRLIRDAAILLPLLLRYSYEFQRNTSPPTWISTLFLDLSVPHETLMSILEAMFYNDEVPFRGRNRKYIVPDLLNIVQRWMTESAQTGGRMFGSEENTVAVSELLRDVSEQGASAGLSEDVVEEMRVLRARVDAGLRR